MEWTIVPATHLALMSLIVFTTTACTTEPPPHTANLSKPAVVAPAASPPAPLAPPQEPAPAPAEDLAPVTVPKPTGTLCVAPLDYSPTPGKGSSSPSRIGGFGSGYDTPAPRTNRTVVVSVENEEKEITMKTGAIFENLPLDEVTVVTLRQPRSSKPYTQIKADFKAHNNNALCIYDNAFYGTTQISDKPRRKFCTKCIAPENARYNQGGGE